MESTVINIPEGWTASYVQQMPRTLVVMPFVPALREPACHQGRVWGGSGTPVTRRGGAAPR